MILARTQKTNNHRTIKSGHKKYSNQNKKNITFNCIMYKLYCSKQSNSYRRFRCYSKTLTRAIKFPDIAQQHLWKTIRIEAN